LPELRGYVSLKRVVTAFIFVPVVLYIVLYAAPVWLLAAVFLITLLALLEYNKLTATKTRSAPLEALTLLFGGAAAPLFYWCGTGAAAGGGGRGCRGAGGATIRWPTLPDASSDGTR
jgi:hypothetical protein